MGRKTAWEQGSMGEGEKKLDAETRGKGGTGAEEPGGGGEKASRGDTETRRKRCLKTT
jgi:hypothetical protein